MQRLILLMTLIIKPKSAHNSTARNIVIQSSVNLISIEKENSEDLSSNPLPFACVQKVARCAYRRRVLVDREMVSPMMKGANSYNVQHYLGHFGI